AYVRRLEGSVSGPLLQPSLVHLDAEARAVEGENRAVGVLDRPAHDVTGEEQRPEELAAPGDGRRRERDVQVRGGAERRLDHAADVAAEAGSLGDARDRHRTEDARRLGELEREDAAAAETRDGHGVVGRAAGLVG